MNGVHDIGGVHGFGPVRVCDDAQFHAEWERLVFAMDRVVRSAGAYNVDEKRHAIERMIPAHYLNASYFERWLAGLTLALEENGYLTDGEHEERLDALLEADEASSLIPERTDETLATGVRDAFETAASFERKARTPKYEPEQAVRVRNIHPSGHTRCPRYVRRAVGEIDRVRGTYVFPDANAHGEERAEPLYSVVFDAEELWGPDAENPTDSVSVDLWEPYLEEP